MNFESRDPFFMTSFRKQSRYREMPPHKVRSRFSVFITGIPIGAMVEQPANSWNSSAGLMEFTFVH
jgi:hypothetical protein